VTRLKQVVRSIGRAILWPVRRFFDPRFAGIAAAIQGNVAATVEATELLGRALDDLNSRMDDLNSRLEARFEAQQRLLEQAREEASLARDEAAHASGRYFERLVGGSVREIDQSVAHLLNYASSHKGFAAQRDLWLNQPVSLAYEPGGVRLANVNERIVEIPHVYRALARLEPGAKVADVGAAESLVAFSLALLGYDVTAVDLRPYPYEHPRLRSVTTPIEEWEHDGAFDAIICLSTIEHVGLGAYGEEPKKDRADIAAMRRMHELAAPGGLLVLTTRFGQARVDELERTYDRAGLDELLEGWNVEELTIVRREDEKTWTLADGKPSENEGAEQVALVTATRM
jgi:2-polyprenyl-3-methyl-5-hydroxy-6-metoxy-1,4-benzoquinol methylase